MALLYDQFGRQIRPTKAPEQRPLAVAPIMDTWREYVTSGLTPQRLAAIFRDADAGDVGRQAMLFDQIEEKDGHLLGEKTKRQNVILDLDFKVTPASDDSRDAKVAEFVEEYLDGLPDRDDTLVAMQDAVGKGFVGLEIDWDVSSGGAVPARFEFIEQKRFLFTDHKGYLRKHPLLLSDESPMGDEIPAWKMVFHRYGGKSGHPTRSGIYRVAAWMYLFKSYSLKDWVTFCEVYGMPLRLGKYDSGAGAEDKNALIDAISSLGSDAAGIISKSTEIEFIETVKGTANGDLYKVLASFANAEMSKSILGQTLSAEVGDKGSYAASKTHNEVRIDLLKADGRAVASTMRDQVVRPMVGFNFGWDMPLPRYEALWDEDEDLQVRSERDKNLTDQGVKFTKKYYQGAYNLKEDEFELSDSGKPEKEEKITAKQPAPAADESPADILNSLEQQTLEQGAVDDLMAPVEKLLAEVETLEEFRDKLPGLFPEMDESALGELMARAMMTADLAGRFDGSPGSA